MLIFTFISESSSSWGDQALLNLCLNKLIVAFSVLGLAAFLHHKKTRTTFITLESKEKTRSANSKQRRQESLT